MKTKKNKKYSINYKLINFYIIQILFTRPFMITDISFLYPFLEIIDKVLYFFYSKVYTFERVVYKHATNAKTKILFAPTL